MIYLWQPLVPHVLKAVRGDGREADDEDVGAWVGESPQGLVLLLAGSVPQLKADLRPLHAHGVGVVVEDGGDVVGGEGARGEGDQHPGLPHLPVPAHHALDALHRDRSQVRSQRVVTVISWGRTAAVDSLLMISTLHSPQLQLLDKTDMRALQSM